MKPLRPLYWYKGMYAGVAPVWLADPEGDCWVEPRGVIGWILEPLVDAFVQAMNYYLSMQDPHYSPHFPYEYQPDREFYRPGKDGRHAGR